MTDNERILNRIKKMMNLANDAGASEGERDNALRMAYATMQKHNIELATIEGHNIVGKGGQEEQREKVVAEYVSHHWARVASMAVAELFFCSYFYSRHPTTGKVRHSFVGRTANAVTAAEMAAYVAKSIQRESATRYRGDGGAQWDFCKGAVTKIVRRCHDMRHEAEQTPVAPVVVVSTEGASTIEPGMGLLLKSFYDKEEEANRTFMVAKLGVKLGKGVAARAAKRESYFHGIEYGAKVSLDRQVKGAQS